MLVFNIPNIDYQTILIIVAYFDIDFNSVCATETKLLKVEMISDILDHTVRVYLGIFSTVQF